MSARVEEALDRLLVSVTAQELAGLDGHTAQKLARRPKLASFAARLVEYAERRLGLGDPALSAGRTAWFYTVLVVGLRVASGTFWTLGLWSIVPQIRARMEDHALRAREVHGYVLASPKEDQVIRISLLLRLLGRRSASVRLLANRLRSPLPADRTVRLLTRWLNDVGEAKAAAMLPSWSPPERGRGETAHVPRRLRYSVVVLTMFDTPIFRTSVRSLLDSDYHGAVVVAEEGNEPTEQCRAFCESIGVGYVKASTWQGCAAVLNRGIERVGTDADIVIASHNDVLWPRSWFVDLDRAWDSVWDGDKVSLLNLNYLQINPRVDPSLTALFVHGEYDDLL